jgi:hypothetical protein
VVDVTWVPPNANAPSVQPVNAQALEFNLPAVVGFEEKPDPLNAVEGDDPTPVGIELLKSIEALGLAFVKFTCPHPTCVSSIIASSNIKERAERAMLIIKYS